jgi:hypothetical protein
MWGTAENSEGTPRRGTGAGERCACAVYRGEGGGGEAVCTASGMPRARFQRKTTRSWVRPSTVETMVDQRKTCSRSRGETCPVSTGRGTRRVQLVREGRGGGRCSRSRMLPIRTFSTNQGTSDHHVFSQIVTIPFA